MKYISSALALLMMIGFACGRTTANASTSQDQNEIDQRMIRLERNEAVELSSIDTIIDPHAGSRRESILSKYKNLRQVLGNGSQLGSSHEFVQPFSLRTTLPNVAYHPLELQAVAAVFEKYGELVIPDSEISDVSNPLWQSLEVARPWAGYWYPRADSILYSGENSVFAKLDRILSRKNVVSKSQEIEASYYEGIVPESWEGLCNAWSLASILVPEPKKALLVEGETLEISDQKGLLTKMHENLEVRVFGVPYDGNYESDGTYQDLRPEAFHKIMTEFLGNRKKAFIVDDNADAEVWQAPVFKVDWSMTRDKDIPSAYFVDARIWKIKNRSRADNLLTSREDLIYRNLQYRLYVDGDVYEREGKRKVIAGEWLGESRKEHPDFVVIPKTDAKMASFNPYLNSNIDLVRKVLLGDQ